MYVRDRVCVCEREKERRRECLCVVQGPAKDMLTRPFEAEVRGKSTNLTPASIFIIPAQH